MILAFERLILDFTGEVGLFGSHNTLVSFMHDLNNLSLQRPGWYHVIKCLPFLVLLPIADS